MNGPRHQAREAALQILYFWEVGRAQPMSAIDAYFEEHLPEASDEVKGFAAKLVLGTVADVTALDGLIEQYSRHWRLDRLAVIDRLIMRLAAWELRHEPDTPAAAVINEALDLARKFSGDEAVKFVNGVLDAIHKAGGASAVAAPGSTPSSD